MSKAKLELNGKTYELPTIVGTQNEVAVDISKLRAQSEAVTFDTGYMNTGACTSKVTFLDGEKGILEYRGFPIEDLAAKSSFAEVSYLLIYGKLPTQTELDNFNKSMGMYSDLHSGIDKMIEVMPANAHPMGVLGAATNALTAFYPELLTTDPNDEQKDKMIAQIMCQMKIIAARFFSKSQGKKSINSDPKLDYSSDFLNMMFGTVDKDVKEALEVLFILHADHEQNCSTSTVRLVGSSKCNVTASIAAGTNALWGPLHGGANQALEMLEAIAKDGADYKKYINKAKDKNDNFMLMGFGHRVYKNFDPRAKIIKKACDSVLNKLGKKDVLLEIAKGLEEAALQDSYFIEKKLYPNVDFYSGIIYRALGIPTNMFTVMFALGRVSGWLAQWKEMMESNEFKIGRPRQIYTGLVNQKYTDIKTRGK